VFYKYIEYDKVTNFSYFDQFNETEEILDALTINDYILILSNYRIFV